MIVPCVVFAFNRPETLRQVLAALRPQDIDTLLIYLDGPRNEVDLAKVIECRNIAGGIDWIKPELHIYERNHGLPGIADIIDDVFARFPMAIFIEDDCLPMPGFYNFMHRSLEHYEANKVVFSIGGYQHLTENDFEDYHYSFVSTARFACWGWGSWRDRWEEIRPYRTTFGSLFNGLRDVPDIAGQDMQPMARSVAAGKTKTWDTQVAISTIWLKKVHLIPVRGLIYNLGCAGEGTHDGRKFLHLHNRNVTEQIAIDITWLEDMTLNPDYLNKYQQFVASYYMPPQNIWRRKVKDALRNLTKR